MVCQLNKTHPNNRTDHKACPEYLHLSLAQPHVHLISSFLKHPHTGPLLIHIVPPPGVNQKFFSSRKSIISPPESRHNTASDVFDCPEVKRKEKNDGNKAANETF